MNRLNRLGLGALALAGLLCGATSAKAECVHGPISLPMLSGPPVWFGAPGATDWRPQLHDPRWVGAPVQLFSTSASGAGALYNAQYRLLQSGGKLYVSIQVLADSNVAATDFVDGVYFGFVEGGVGTGARVLSIAPNRGTPVAAPDPSVPRDPGLPVLTDAGFISWYDTANIAPNPPTWTAHQGNQPPWLQDVATWNNSPGVIWAITFKIDLAMANSLSTSKIFVGVRIGNGAGTVVRLGNSALAATEAASINSETIVLPNEDTWVPYDVPGTACTTGASISYSDVGVVSGANLVSTIQACGGAGSPCPAAGVKNKFRVKVQNVDNAVLTAQYSVRANIRLADWGSTISNWQFAPWKQLDGISPTVFTDPTASFTSPTWTWDTTPGVTHGEARIDFECTPAANSYCPLLTNPDNYGGDQCMLVEVQGAPGFQAQVPIANGSVYRNMQFAGLSTLDHKAKIDIKGLQALTGQAAPRDVYLHVQALNMPPHGKEPVFPSVKAMALARRYAENPPNIPLPVVPREGGEKGPAKPGDKAVKPGAKPPVPVAPKAGAPAPVPVAPKAPAPAKPYPEAPPAPVPPAPAQGQFPPLSPKVSVFDVPVMTPSQALESAYPTYKIYPYYDTGSTTVIKGQTFKVLEPMVPFGYYLEHDGPLYGFTHLLEGVSGVTVTKVDENFYKVQVANEGSVDVSTKITAEEKPKGDTQPPQCPTCPPHGRCNCDVPGAPVADAGWLAAAGALGLAVALRRGRRRRRG